jgi:hypothetical protein
MTASMVLVLFARDNRNEDQAHGIGARIGYAIPTRAT